ncbi:MAG: heme lyase CcmF/NrfE family subunit [Chloroflexi bacterium]|nr:heme lyase CcmF/NrfE family subunit [Chloroflexota bacterium]
MLANFGYGALVISLAVSLYGIGAAIYGERNKQPRWVDSARNAMLLTFPLLTLAAASIIILLVTNRFELDYVYSVTSRSMPTYLRVTALWGGQPGSLVFWSWLLSLFTSAVTLRDWRRDREFLPWVIVVALVTLAFFLVLIIAFENPFLRYWTGSSGAVVTAMFQPRGLELFTPADGRGLNPLLRHPGMIIHPPLLYLGFVSLTIPFAFAIAALITGRTDDRWIRLTRRWTLWAWLFLSLGLILGGRWAYDVLGWGGYWGWDPVEVAALMPWLTATPFLHSVMIQEKRNMFKHWNMLLIIITYDLMILGTFLTRSGVLSSVHAFAQSAIGPMFFGYIVITLAVSLALLSRRWDELKSEGELTSWLSREALFLINNLVFIAILVVCLWGVFFPILTEALGIVGQAFPSVAHIFNGQKVTVGPLFYERATGPLWAALLLLMGIAPLSAWRASTGRTLGRGMVAPTIASVVALIAVAAFSEVRQWAALLAIWLCFFVVFVTLYEFIRAAAARAAAHSLNFIVALWQLAGRNRRRYGGYIIHLGVVLMAVGIIGIEMFQTETQASLKLGETLALGRYSIRYDSLAEFDTNDNRNVARAVVTVFKDGREVGELYPRRDYFYESDQPMTIPGVRASLEDDFYVLLVDWQPISTQNATFKVYHNPLVNWLWLGSLVFIAGTFVAAWPEKDAQPQPERSRAARAAARA